MRFLPSLGTGFAYIMKKRRPSEEQGFCSPPSRCTCHVVQDLQGMVEIILVGTPVSALHTAQGSNFRQDKFKQSATFQLYESYAWNGREHNLVELVNDTLLGNNLDALCIAAKRLLCLVLDTEIELCCKTYAPHHAQWIVAEGYVRVKRSNYQAVLHVPKSVETVNQLPKRTVVQAYSQCVDCKVTPVQVVLQRPVLDDWLSAVARIALAPCTNKLHLLAIPFHLCCTKILEYRHIGTASQLASQRLCQTNARRTIFGLGSASFCY